MNARSAGDRKPPLKTTTRFGGYFFCENIHCLVLTCYSPFGVITPTQHKTGANTMRLIPPLLQIAMLSLGFASNRADAMAGAAVFAVLTVAVVLIKDRRGAGSTNVTRSHS